MFISETRKGHEATKRSSGVLTPHALWTGASPRPPRIGGNL